MATIEFRGVEKVYGDGTRAVRAFDLAVGDGELMVLVGPSGCGKSTILKLLAGLESLTAGEIRIGSRRVDGLSPQERDVAMVFQSYALYPHMTVRENLAFPLRVRRVPRRERERRIAAAARVLSIEDLLDRRPARLSGGQRQRVAMGRAVVRDPVAFLMDEPLSNLDAQLRIRMRAEVASLQRRLGATTLYVTHDQAEALTLGQRLAVLREGELQQVGTPGEVYRRPANTFVASFLGSPGMNLFRSRLVRSEGGDLGLCFGDRVLPLAGETLARLPGLAVRGEGGFIAGLRPEAFAPPEGAPAARRFPAAVVAVEALGHETVLHFRGPAAPLRGLAEEGEPTMTARLPAGWRAAVGEEIELAIAVDELHAFDPEGRSLAGEGRGEG